MLKIARSRTDKAEFALGNADLEFPYVNRIPEEAFKKGLERIKNAKQSGEKWISSYTILKYQLNKK